MNQPESENPPAPAAAPQAQPTDSRRRLRELLSVPERDRTDEQWDEIIELEIQLAPGNRVSTTEQGGPQGGGGQQQKPAGQGKKHRPRGNNNRRQRQNKPPGNAA
jgi:hypothetical protein